MAYAKPIEDLDILLIGAAPLPRGSSAQDAEDLRHFAVVQADLQRMLNFCSDPKFIYEDTQSFGKRSRVNAVQTLVNHADLMPPPPVNKRNWLFDTIYKPTVYTSKREVRQELERFLEEAAAPNLMIYFTGHGTSRRAERSEREREEALLLPVSHHSYGDTWTPRVEAYTNGDLTNDIDRHLPRDKRLYIVVDADHGENAINLWELKKSVRLQQPVVLFAGANREIPADYTDDGGVFTRTFVEEAKGHLGKPLWELAQRILERLPFNADKPRSPAFLYGYPNLCKQNFLTA